ncbi:unnamed protein product [Vitrella brassicaformis CCMP3155]|uniref:Uncharacterized protein n=1 Tax=Vitrella brassicaformis (strain CCMP3155) TaxID=1169540 RepID=A0A0G4GYN1_VITBC|nr:unnamed protein product [Vitrella brassicaformis CCMP3155]|eukprot:CEM36021.1 unnamed protein product [Vitrella brassicaformis CCMP3155]
MCMLINADGSLTSTSGAPKTWDPCSSPFADGQCRFEKPCGYAVTRSRVRYACKCTAETGIAKCESPEPYKSQQQEAYEKCQAAYNANQKCSPYTSWMNPKPTTIAGVFTSCAEGCICRQIGMDRVCAPNV